MKRLCHRLAVLVFRDDGQDLIEYGVLASLVSLVAMLAVGNFGTEVAAFWAVIADGIDVVP